jgi:hypothetical protein
MSDPNVDKAVFAFLASCIGDFTQWPQCESVNLWGDINDDRLYGVRFEVRATNLADKTRFKIVVTKDDDWRVRVIQVANHIRLDGVDADRELIVHAVNRFMELAGMVEERES